MGSAPVAREDGAVTDENRVVDIAVLANDRIPDRDAVRVVSVTQGANGSVVVNGDDTIRYQPNAGFHGPDDFSYTIADETGAAASAAVSVWVRDLPDAPVAEDQTVETDEDTVVVIALVASDADGDALAFSIGTPPENGTIVGTPPDVTYVPDADFNGSDGFVFRADDGHGGIDDGVVSISIRAVDDVPIANDDEAETDEGRVVDIAVLANDRDPDGGAVRVTASTQGANGSVVVNGDSTIRYQPAAGFTGSDGFAYTIADASGKIATATVSVRIRNVPDAPVAENQTVETDEDTALVISLVASDADGDPLSYTIERPPANGTIRGTPPDVSYLPDPDFNGSDGFVFRADDGHGGVDTGVVSISVRPVEDVPIAVDDEADTDEGRVVDIRVLANDRDPDGDPVRVVAATQALSGSVVVNGDDSLRYQPGTGFTGPDGFAYTIADASGATATATVSVWVRNTSDVPVAENQNVETDEDNAVVISLVASDADGDALAFSIERPPANGTIRGTPPDVTYVPDADFNGSDGFVFAANDGHDGVDLGVVSIAVHPVDDVPIAANDVAETTESRVVDIPVLANDRDPDGDVVRVVAVTQGLTGSIVVNGDDTVRYQPLTGFSGPDGFAYTIADPTGATATATVSVSVRGTIGTSMADPR